MTTGVRESGTSRDLAPVFSFGFGSETSVLSVFDEEGVKEGTKDRNDRGDLIVKCGVLGGDISNSLGVWTSTTGESIGRCRLSGGIPDRERLDE